MEIRIADEKDLKSVFDLRVEVFVNEQNVPPEVELDEEDSHALHIIAVENGITVGCARVILSENDSDAHIGRLAVKKPYRGKHIGQRICGFIIEYCRAEGCSHIWLNSQLHASGFYKKLGFTPQGEIFTEAGIEHIRMEIIEKLLGSSDKIVFLPEKA